MPPYSFLDSDCKPQGMVVDFVRRVAARSGVPVEAMINNDPYRGETPLPEGISVALASELLLRHMGASAVRQVYVDDIKTVVFGTALTDTADLRDYPVVSPNAPVVMAAAVNLKARMTVVRDYDLAIARWNATPGGGLVGLQESVVFNCLAYGCDLKRMQQRLTISQEAYWFYAVHRAYQQDDTSVDLVLETVEDLSHEGLWPLLREHYLSARVASQFARSAPQCDPAGMVFPLLPDRSRATVQNKDHPG